MSFKSLNLIYDETFFIFPQKLDVNYILFHWKVVEFSMIVVVPCFGTIYRLSVGKVVYFCL